jgi:ribosomal protein L7/L12
MTTLLVSGWRVGFNKVEFTKLLRTGLGYSLSRAKRTTDAVLDAGAVELQVPDGEAEGLLATMDELGAVCGVAVPSR